MDLRIVRNFMVGLLDEPSRIGDVVRADTQNKYGFVNLLVPYKHNHDGPELVELRVTVKENSDEKYVAKQFVAIVRSRNQQKGLR